MTALSALENADRADVLITRLTFPPGNPNGVSLALMARAKRPVSNRRAIAYHEAAHAAIFIHYGYRPNWAKLMANNAKRLGAIQTPAGQYRPNERAAALLAGGIAEARLTGVPLEKQSTSRGDIVDAANALNLTGGPFQLASLLPHVHQLVNQHWHNIGAIADALMLKGELSYPEILALTQQRPQWASPRFPSPQRWAN